MFTSELVPLSLDPSMLSSASLGVDRSWFALRKNFAGKVEILAVFLKIQSELWVFEGAAVVMPKDII